MINHSTTSQFTRELDELRSVYLKALPEKVRLIGKAWRSLDTSNWDATDYKAVYRLLHNLAGGAGTYGLSSITRQARSLLDTMKPWLDRSTPLESDIQLQIDQGLQLLQETTRKAIQSQEQETHYLRKPTAPVRDREVIVSEIYLVEDDPDQANFLKLVLERAGHRVQVFDNLEDVKIAMLAIEPTAILMDMVFPEGDLAGADAIAEIQEGRTIPVPIVFISTRTDLEARLSAVRAGAWHYFAKPVNANKLVHLVNSYTHPIRTRQHRVLLVDDDSAISALFAQHLDETGYLKASLLTEPLLLLETLEEIRPDLILMDYHMPGCNGLELAAVVRQHENYSDLPIIFLTEETNIEAKLTALNLGSDDFFTKSMGPERLVLAVQSRLERIKRLTSQPGAYRWSSN